LQGTEPTKEPKPVKKPLELPKPPAKEPLELPAPPAKEPASDPKDPASDPKDLQEPQPVLPTDPQPDLMPQVPAAQPQARGLRLPRLGFWRAAEAPAAAPEAAPKQPPQETPRAGTMGKLRKLLARL
jgi:hypothetical protein